MGEGEERGVCGKREWGENGGKGHQRVGACIWGNKLPRINSHIRLLILSCLLPEGAETGGKG